MLTAHRESQLAHGFAGIELRRYVVALVVTGFDLLLAYLPSEWEVQDKLARLPQDEAACRVERRKAFIEEEIAAR